MQVRQALDFYPLLAMLAWAETDEAQINEMKALIQLQEKIKQNECIQTPFDPVLVLLESSKTIQEIKALVGKHRENDNVLHDESLKAFSSFFIDRYKRGIDYFPALPTLANDLTWTLAELLSAPLKREAAYIVLPLLKSNVLSKTTIIQKESRMILNGTGQYGISLSSYLNNTAKLPEFSYHNHALDAVVFLTDDELMRLGMCLGYYQRKPADLINNKTRLLAMENKVKLLQEKCKTLFHENKKLQLSYDHARLELTHSLPHIGNKDWRLFLNLISDRVPLPYSKNIMHTLFEKYSLEEIEETILQNQSFDTALKDSSLYNGKRNHDAAILYFFGELYWKRREKGDTYNSLVPYFIPRLAYSKEQKESAIIALQAFLMSDEPLTVNSLKAYLIKNGNEKLINPLFEDNSQTGAIVKQIDALDKRYSRETRETHSSKNNTVSQGLFSSWSKSDTALPDIATQDPSHPKIII